MNIAKRLILSGLTILILLNISCNNSEVDPEKELPINGQLKELQYYLITDNMNIRKTRYTYNSDGTLSYLVDEGMLYNEGDYDSLTCQYDNDKRLVGFNNIYVRKDGNPDESSGYEYVYLDSDNLADSVYRTINGERSPNQWYQYSYSYSGSSDSIRVTINNTTDYFSDIIYQDGNLIRASNYAFEELREEILYEYDSYINPFTSFVQFENFASGEHTPPILVDKGCSANNLLKATSIFEGNVSINEMSYEYENDLPIVAYYYDDNFDAEARIELIYQ